MAADTRIHHLNCGTFCPRSRRLVNGAGGWLSDGRMVCHCLLIEGGDGLALVDTGLGREDAANPGQLSILFKAIARPRLDEAETAHARLRALGFNPDDVRHIVLTHLDVDHAGGLPDFPSAEVHVLGRERELALNPGWRERTRYVQAHWAHGPRWVDHAPEGDDWLGFESVRVLEFAGTELLLIPLPGHTGGHAGVAVAASGGWLLHCGDAYFYHGEVETPAHAPSFLRAYENLVQIDGSVRRANQERLRELALGHSEVELICSHDPLTLERAAG